MEANYYCVVLLFCCFVIFPHQYWKKPRILFEEHFVSIDKIIDKSIYRYPVQYLQEKQPNIKRSSPFNILVVDDEKDITFTFRVRLEGNGFKVTTFNDPVLALSCFTPGNYDALLLDIRMPQMGGFEFYRKVRKLDSRILVYFMTAFEQYYGEFKQALPRLASAYFIRKPVEIDHLVQELKSKLSALSLSDHDHEHR